MTFHPIGSDKLNLFYFAQQLVREKSAKIFSYQKLERSKSQVICLHKILTGSLYHIGQWFPTATLGTKSAP